MLSNLSIGKRLAVVLGSILALSLATDLFATLWLQRLGDQMMPLLREDAQRQTLAGLLASCQWQLLAGSALSMIVGGVLATQLARSITRPLQQSQTLAAALADLDLRGQSHAPYSNDEAGQLLRALDTLRHSLQHSLHDVRGVASQLSTATGQINAGNHHLSTRTEQAADNLQQTAGAIEQLTGTVRQSTDSAAQANQLARSAAEVAERGGSIVAEVVATMGAINASSRRIADIIGVIDGIAFQTNILALNAAVEAARAGEQGRGFAVVAGEVRTLAQRSAGAAKEIKALINDSVGKVESGATQVHAAGTTMTEIVASVKRVSDIVGQITATAGDQSHGIDQVTLAVSQLDQMTQQNAALVEQSSAAAFDLQDQAQRLAQAVAAYKLDQHRPAATFEA